MTAKDSYTKEALENTRKALTKKPDNQISKSLDRMYNLGYKHGYEMARLDIAKELTK